MSPRWTDSLVPGLATKLRDLAWRRIEPARGENGGWFALSAGRDGEPGTWHRLRSLDAELEPVTIFGDEALPAISERVARWLHSGVSCRLLAHKVGSRAVFLLERDGTTSIAKIYRRDRGVLARWHAFDHAGPAHWRVPRVIDWDPARCVLTIEHSPLPSLHSRWVAGLGCAEDGDRISNLIEFLRASSPSRGLPVHDVTDEIRVIRDRSAEFHASLAAPPAGAAALVERVIAALADHPPHPLLPAHRDFHDKQILLAPEWGGVLLDLDLAASAPPALDAGNILAHVRLRALQRLRMPWQEIAARVAQPQLTGGLEETLYRWTAAALVRLSLIYARRARPAHLVDQLLLSAAQALERNGEWEDLL